MHHMGKRESKMDQEKEKEEFLKEFGEDYGYPNAPKSIDQIRSTEFNRLNQQGIVYLDHAGATLYSELQMESIFKQLTSSVYGNPHSLSESSNATAEVIKEAREMVLEFCNASPKDYKCIFTSGATSALKLIGEAFPWTPSSCFMYSFENHNSVLGIREYALSLGASACALDIEDTIENGNFMTKVSQRRLQRRTEFCDDEITGDAYNLFAIPSECNFSGLKFNLNLVNIIKEDSERVLGGSPFCRNKWMFLIDAAKGCATEKLDLSKYPADFVVLSFYKLFGYPTGLGALLVSNDAVKLLSKNYFGGGTVAASISDLDFVKRREAVEERFEDGTSSFLSIAAIRYGFKILNTLTIRAISRHTASLATYLRRTLLDLRHENGARVCVLYGDHISKDMGPVVSFNLKRPDGSWFGYREVEKLASLSGIQLRTGCFCNPGACAKYLGLSHQDLLSNIEAGHVCWDDHDVLHGKPTGAVRVSFGYMSTYEDMKTFLDFVKEYFVKSQKLSLSCLGLEPQPISVGSQEVSGFEREPGVGIRVKSIHVYPIKSCGGFSAKHWPLSGAGLLHDREWLLKSLTGEILSLKKVPEMFLVTTYIDLDRGKLIVQSPRCEQNMQIKITSELHDCSEEEIELCTPRHGFQHYDDDVNKWFSRAIGRPCVLVRCSSSANHISSKRHGGLGRCRDTDIQSNFSNAAEFLLISEESVSDLNNRVNSSKENSPGDGSVVTANRFRPNFVISGAQPYAEDSWKSLQIGRILFASVGGCNRCHVINFSVEGGRVHKSKEPLVTLASYRRLKGRILFGILLKYDYNNEREEKDLWLEVGDEVFPNII